jgi:hypothetical protein
MQPVFWKLRELTETGEQRHFLWKNLDVCRMHGTRFSQKTERTLLAKQKQTYYNESIKKKRRDGENLFLKAFREQAAGASLDWMKSFRS